MDIMHVFFENIVTELLQLWEGTFRSRQVTGDSEQHLNEDFVIGEAQWRNIDEEVVTSFKTVPTEMAERVRSIRKRGYWTAESYSYFLLFLGPIVMKDRLPFQYYKHFLALSEIARGITRLEISRGDLSDLKNRLARWVRDFERQVQRTILVVPLADVRLHRLYYRYQVNRLPFLTAPIHSLLHLHDQVLWQGPPCMYWCFSLERFAGWMKDNVDNWKDTTVAMGNSVKHREQVRDSKTKDDYLHLPKCWFLCQMHQVMSSLTAEGRKEVLAWARGGSKDAPWVEENYQAGRLYDKIKHSVQLSGRVLTAVRTHLATRDYSDTNMHPRIPQEEFSAIQYGFYGSYRSSTDAGLHVWRTSAGSRRSERDASWTLVRSTANALCCLY